jgi:fatty acid desaturase/predicted heme/steroid binding protein
MSPDLRLDKSVYTWEQIREHTTTESCWIVVSGNVYDVTEWLDDHPGGGHVILITAGYDATDAFNAFHRMDLRDRRLKPYLIGRVTDYKVSSTTLAFRKVAKDIEESKLMNTTVGFYARIFSALALLLLAVFYLVLSHSGSILWGVVTPAVLMGVFLQQIAFVGHDLGHMAVTHDRVMDARIGIIFGNSLSGVALGWWKATHNTHHVVTNSLVADPDIQHLPFFAVHHAFSEGVYSTFHSKELRFDSLSRFLVSIQAYMYYVIMAFARVNLYLQSYLFLLGSDRHRESRVKTNSRLEVISLLVFAVWFTWLVSNLQGTGSKLVFIIVSHALAGVLHIQITLSHFALPVYSVHPLSEDSFLQHQLKTSLDIDCPPWMDWIHGGLQFQVVHHLFPRAPRESLRTIKRMIQDFALEHHLEYQSVGFLAANKMVMSRLETVSVECRSKLLMGMLNMEG